jgi:GT2 family glycosyltransferase
MSARLPRVGAVVLTYNSAADLPTSLDGLIAQQEIDTRIIIVDNASNPENLASMEAVFRSRFPDGVILDVSDANPSYFEKASAIFVRNPQNMGYSAGNNVGARLAVRLGCETVLIVNPDIRISDPRFVVTLWSGMQSDERCLVASPRILTLAGRDEHPLREPSFWEELLWMRHYGPRKFRPPPYVITPSGTASLEAGKVHGSCLMVRSSFLEQMGFLDEMTFLYSEEPILAARVRSANGKLIVFPEVKAIHAHVASAKGNASLQMLIFIKSRLYYLDTYSDYGPAQRAALHVSYRMLAILHWIKARFGSA